MKYKDIEYKNLDLCSRTDVLIRKHKLYPHSNDYLGAVQSYSAQYTHAFDFFSPYLNFTILNRKLYYTAGLYVNPPILISTSDNLFLRMKLPMPEPALRERLFQGLKTCLKNWIRPWNTEECGLSLIRTPNDCLDTNIKNISQIKAAVIKVSKVLESLKSYYLKNGLPPAILDAYAPTPLDPFNKQFFQFEKNIIWLNYGRVIPLSHQVRVVSADVWLLFFNEKAKGYDRSTILSAHPALCKVLKQYRLNPYPKNTVHNIILCDNKNYFLLKLNGRETELSTFYPQSTKFLYLTMQMLNCNQQEKELAKIAVNYLLQQKLTNLSFFKNLITALYTGCQASALYIVRLSDDSSFNDAYKLQLQKLFNLYDITSVITKQAFLPENLSDWYSHVYCAAFQVYALNTRSEDFMIKWIKGYRIKANYEGGAIYYNNSMPSIMFVAANQDISYLKTFLKRRSIQLRELELSLCSCEMPVIQEHLWDYIRFLLLLGDTYNTNKLQKENTVSKNCSQETVLQDFVKRFCSVDSKNAEPLLSKAFYKDYVVPFYEHLHMKPIGPTKFNKTLQELFPNQIICQKYHPKNKVEGQHIFNMVFHEHKWNAYFVEKQTDDANEEDSFLDKLQALEDHASEIADWIFPVAVKLLSNTRTSKLPPS